MCDECHTGQDAATDTTDKSTQKGVDKSTQKAIQQYYEPFFLLYKVKTKTKIREA